MKSGECDKLEFVAQGRKLLPEREHLFLRELERPVERGRAVVSQQFVRMLCMNSLSKLARMAQVGMRCFAPNQVSVRSVRNATRNGLFESILHTIKSF